MIRINLLKQKKAKPKADKGQQGVMLMLLGLICYGGLLYFFVHKPLSDEVEQAQQQNNQKQASNDKMAAQVKDLDQIKAALKEVQDRSQAIQRLADARAVPAWFLRELSKILTPPGRPTMTEDTVADLQKPENQDEQFDHDDFDPKRVWIMSIEEKGGDFTLKGGAASDSDVSKFALRLQASMFFDQIVPEGGEVYTDQAAKASYYKFTITGKALY